MEENMIDWETIEPKQFEFLCSLILEVNDFTQIQWFGKSGSDKGRDLVAKKYDEPITGHKRLAKWVVQCKRLIKSKLTKTDISEFLNSCKEHEPDNVLIIVTQTLSSNMKDWIESIKKEFKFSIFIWEEREISREIVKHKDYISKNYPQYSTLPPEAREVRFFKQNENEMRIFCNEWDEVGFFVYNINNYEEAAKKVQHFVEFIRTHKLKF